jgi:signal transduction histidine kinase/DNA-binding response OmpR family regulator/ligand-binding sensor domain-containing protein
MPNYRVAVFIGLLLASASVFLYSQTPYKPIQVDPLTELWRWRQFPELTGKGYRCVTESNDGTMWFGVDKGVIKYNGATSVYFNKETGFENISVNSISYSNSNNSIYAGTDSGIYVYSNSKWKRIFPRDNVYPSNKIMKTKCLRVLKDGSVIAGVGTSNYTGIIFIRNDIQTFISSKKVIRRVKGKLKNTHTILIPDNLTTDDKFDVEEIYEDTQQRIWFSTRCKNIPTFLFHAKMLYTNPDSLVVTKLFNEKEGYKHGRYTLFYQTKNGNIWLVNSEHDLGISIYNEKSWRYFKLSDIVGDDDLHTSILETDDGAIWIGGMGNLYILKNNVWKRYHKPTSPIPFSRINLYKDKKGSLWIMGKQNEIIQIDYSSNIWQTYPRLNYQCESQDGRKWFISVDGRIVCNDNNTWYSYGPENGLPDAPVRIYLTSKNMLWVAGSHKGMASTAWLNGNRWNMKLHPALSWGIDYRAVFEDKDGNLWFGCSVDKIESKGQVGGVLKLENPGMPNEKWTHFDPKGTYNMYNAYGIGQSKDGSIWLGGTRLVKFDGKKWQQIDTSYQVQTYYDQVLSDSNGTLWAASRYYGIFSYDGQKWTNYNVQNGLSSNTVIYILPSKNNNLTIATDKDFCRFDGTSWMQNIFPQQMTLTREGGDLKISADGTYWINKSLREWKRRPLKNNRLTEEVIENFISYSYKPDTMAPNTVITEYAAEVSPIGNTIIGWAGNDYWHATPKERLAFSYRVNGGKWSEFKEKNYETFINLKSGTYTFEVRARDFDFNIDPTPALIKFKVLPPFWKQIWFVLLMIFFAFVITYYEIIMIRKNRKLTKLNKSLQQATIQLEKQKEQILEQNISERENYQAKIKFFTSISHEFRTPLTLISTGVDKINQSFETNPSEFHKYIHIIKRNSNHLLQLINQLMDFKKLDSESMELYTKKGNIASFVHSICCNFKNQTAPHNVDLIFHNQLYNDEAWFDYDKIEKIMYNLLSNSLKFTPDGGAIKVSISQCTDGKDPDQYYSISVADTGLGIPEDEIVKIIEPFYQGKTTPVRKYEGTGLGLSIVKNLVDLHQGKLIIKSSTKGLENEGYTTMVTINLPFVYNYIESKEEKISYDDQNSVSKYGLASENYEEQSASFANYKESRQLPLVLLVEDNEELSNLICDALKEQFNFLQAKNGSEGYDIAIDKMPDLIVSDIMMPVMSGIEMCIKIKNDPQTSHIPVILLTARSTDENKLEGFENGADDYLTKPFSMRLLSARILNLINIRLSLRKKFRNEIILQPNAKYVTSSESIFINKVMSIIEEKMSDPNFDVDTLSKEVGISSRHLLNKLQSLTDHTPVELIRTLRLKRAEYLLAQKSLTIAEVAYDVGFSDPNYFSKCFTKQYGKTPKEYIANGGAKN